MDAVKFQKEMERMCRSYWVDCAVCPLKKNGCFRSTESFGDLAEKRVEIVEGWSKEHQFATNREKFEEVFGCDMLVTTDLSWWDAEYEEKSND